MLTPTREIELRKMFGYDPNPVSELLNEIDRLRNLFNCNELKKEIIMIERGKVTLYDKLRRVLTPGDNRDWPEDGLIDLIKDLQADYVAERKESERWIARVKLLETKLEDIRKIVK